MIAFFPAAYPDELLYSQISRYHKRTGNARLVFTAEEVFRNGKLTYPSVEFVNGYTEDALKWLTKKKAWEMVAEEHTMFPAYIRFLPLERRRDAIEGIINCNGNWKNLMCLPVLNEKRYLRYCTECAREDRVKYGETYWHREHQIQRIRVCPKHKMFLKNSNIPMSSKTTPGLFDAESNIPKCIVPSLCDNRREIEFTQYVLDVFRRSVDIKTDFLVGAYLQSKLPQKYKIKSGLMCHISQFYNDYTRVYDGMPIMSKTYMQKIFNGYMFDVYYILQLAFIKGISIYDITHIPAKTNEFNDLYERLAKKYNIDYVVVVDIGAEILKQKVHKISSFSGPRRKEYDRLDEELLPKVREVVDGIRSRKGRPEKLSVTKVQRIMNLPQKQLNKLPKCKAYIEQHTESQEAYWARQVDWAIKVIEDKSETVTISKIMKLTNMRKRDIKRCISKLKTMKNKSLIMELLDDNP